MQACHNRRLGALPPHQITDYRVELHFSHFRQALSRGGPLELEVTAKQFESTMMCQRPTTFVQEKGDSFSIAQNPTQNVVCVMENDMMREVKSTGGLKRGAEQSGSYDQPQAHAFEGDNFAQPFDILVLSVGEPVGEPCIAGLHLRLFAPVQFHNGRQAFELFFAEIVDGGGDFPEHIPGVDHQDMVFVL